MITVQSTQVIQNAPASSTIELPVYTGTAESMTICTSHMAVDDAVAVYPIVNGEIVTNPVAVLDLETLETVNPISKNGCYAVPCAYGYDGVMISIDTGTGGTTVFVKSCRTA